MALAIFKSPDRNGVVQMPGKLADVQFVNGEAVVENDEAIAEMRALAKIPGINIFEVSTSDLESEAEKAAAHAAALKQLLTLQQATSSNGGASAHVGVSTSSNLNATAAESTAQVAGAAAANKALNKVEAA